MGVATGVTGPGGVGAGVGVEGGVVPPAEQTRMTGSSGSGPVPICVFHVSFTNDGALAMYPMSVPPRITQTARTPQPRPSATLTSVSMRPPVHSTRETPPEEETAPEIVPVAAGGAGVTTGGTGVGAAVPGTR